MAGHERVKVFLIFPLIEILNIENDLIFISMASVETSVVRLIASAQVTPTNRIAILDVPLNNINTLDVPFVL